MQLKDFATLADAKLYTQSTLKSSDARMLNERGIFSLIGLADGEVLMQAIEGSVDIPARVKSWFKPSEQGIDIADPNALGILAGMVAANVLTQANSDLLSGYAYVKTQPFTNATAYEFSRAKGTISYLEKTPLNGYVKLTSSSSDEYLAVFYSDIQGVRVREGSVNIKGVGEYIVRANKPIFIENYYNALV